MLQGVQQRCGVLLDPTERLDCAQHRHRFEARTGGLRVIRRADPASGRRRACAVVILQGAEVTAASNHGG